MMFFQSMAGLLSPLYRGREGVKWGVISYTLALFSIVTVYTAMNLDIESVSYIDNRDFPGVKGMLPPGPLGFRSFLYADALSITPNVMFFLNNWLADAFLVSSFSILYYLCQGSNAGSSPATPLLHNLRQEPLGHRIPLPRVPCIRWYVSARVLRSPAATFWANSINIGMGMLVIFQMSQPVSESWAILLLRYSIPWISVAVSLNVLLTLMIVLRLFLGSRSVRAATGSSTGISGLYMAVATMLIESCSLYAVNVLVLIGLWVTNSAAAGAFLVILSEIQVCDTPQLRPSD